MDQNSTNSPKTRPGVGFWTATLLVLVALAVYVGRLTGGPDRVPWAHDIESARSAAEESGKPMLLNFTSDGCPPCRDMKRHVFSRPEVAEAIESRYEPVKIDLSDPGPSEQGLAERHVVMYLPTLLVVGSDDEEWARTTGYREPQELVSWLGRHGVKPEQRVGSGSASVDR